MKVTASSKAPAPKFAVKFASEFVGGKPGGELETISVAALEDDKSTLVSKIIMGFFGGTFVSSDGMRVKQGSRQRRTPTAQSRNVTVTH